MAVVPTSSRGGQVTSVFSRTGAVVAATNDYTDAQVQDSPTNVLTATGDILYASAANTLARLGKPADGTYGVTFASAVPSWAALSSGALTLLSTTTLSGAGTFDVSSISQAYNDLRLVLIARGDVASGTDVCSIRFNNDSTGTYGDQQLRGQAATPTAAETNSATSALLGLVVAASTGAGWFSFFDVWIPGYTSTTWRKSYHSQNNLALGITTGAISEREYMGNWNSTAAINRITIITSGGQNFIAGSTLRIYGVL